VSNAVTSAGNAAQTASHGLRDANESKSPKYTKNNGHLNNVYHDKSHKVSAHNTSFQQEERPSGKRGEAASNIKEAKSKKKQEVVQESHHQTIKGKRSHEISKREAAQA